MITKAAYRTDDATNEETELLAERDAQSVNSLLAAYALIQVDEIEKDSLDSDD